VKEVRMSRTRVVLAGLVTVALVAACSPASTSSTASSTSADPATATVLFTQDSPLGSVAMVGPPDGQGATRLLPEGRYGNPALAASADGSVLAWTAYRVTAQATSVPTYWVSMSGHGYPVPLPSAARVGAARVAADGRAVYYVVGRSLERYDATDHALTTMCTSCLGAVPFPAFGLGLAVSPDERTVAVSWTDQPHENGSPISGQATVADVASSKVLWHVEAKDIDVPVVWTFADDDTLVTTVGVGPYAATASIDKVSGFRSSGATVTPTGLVGYGPITHVDGVWWYARDTPGTQVTTTLYVNADLTPAGERKLVDRVDGETSFGYTPVTTAPGPIAVVTPSPSSS
jgi:hypothetical protein